MKKLALAIVCLFSVAFFASCDPEIQNPEPKIAIITGDSYISGTVDNPQTINFFDTIDWAYGFHVESNDQTKKELSSLKIYIEAESEEGTFDTTYVKDLTGMTSYDFVEHVFTERNRNIMASFIIKATVTDVDNQFSTTSIAFKIDMPALPLEAQPFVWKREGVHNGEGLEMFGLVWNKNLKDINAVIEPVEGAVLYRIANTSIWDEINTDVELAALFSDGTQVEVIPDYRGVSCLASQEYDDLIATYYQGIYYLIHVTKGTVENRMFVFTIEGEWK